jgi:hypothetical protein
MRRPGEILPGKQVPAWSESHSPNGRPRQNDQRQLCGIHARTGIDRVGFTVDGARCDPRDLCHRMDVPVTQPGNQIRADGGDSWRHVFSEQSSAFCTPQAVALREWAAVRVTAIDPCRIVFLYQLMLNALENGCSLQIG